MSPSSILLKKTEPKLYKSIAKLYVPVVIYVLLHLACL
jgi:hypothetical protein